MTAAATIWRAATLTTWGRTRYAPTATLDAPADDRALAAAVAAQSGPLAAYGGGRCYGDAALNSGGRTVLTRARQGVIAIDDAAATVVAEAGASFSDLSAALHGRGLTYPVSAATGAVTLGGALANDIHSKNHHTAGSFGRHVAWFDLMTADGTVHRVDRTSDPELFRATVGGLGLTGIVLRLELALVRVAAPAADVTYRRMANLDAFLDALEEGRPTEPFWFGWIDALAQGREMGRGILETGHYAPDASGVAPPAKPFTFAFDLPRALLHPAIVARYNARRVARLPAGGAQVRKSLDAFYFPLDHLAGFNRVYGRRGFYSIHAGIPFGDRAGVHALLSEIVKARAGSVGTVLKPMGGPGEGMISFPFKGYAFAADLPRRAGVEELHARLERIVLDHGGRLYAAKDALMSAKAFARMFPGLEAFRATLRRIDPQGRFQTDMSRRLGIRPELAGPS